MQRSLTDWQQLHGNAFQNTRVLVTGGAGFIGSHLVEALLQLGASVIVLDDLSGGSRENLAEFTAAEFVEGSILDRDLLGRTMRDCTYVLHQAALGSVPRSVEQPALYHDVNATGTFNVLEAARQAGVRRVTFAASSSAYGDSEVLPKVETMPPLPRSPYAATKAAGEATVRAYTCSYGLDAVSLRYFNIFGPRQNANSAYAAVIAAFAKAVLAGEPPVIYGDGEQSRDFTFVHNAVHANLLAARSDRPLAGEVINIACGQRITVNQLAEMVTAILEQKDLKPVHKPERAGDVKHSLADLTRARQLIGYRPIVDFQPGLEQTLHWYRQTMG
jgi:nucleoside-diphosphate-sugar epimerase